MTPMTFNSFAFLFGFLPVALFGYSLLRTTRWVNHWLFIVSLFFYATAGLIYLLPLLFTCVFDYWVGKYVGSERAFSYRRQLFVLSIVVQLSLLAVCKYLGWISLELKALSSWLGLSFSVFAVSMILPPGISFYTFHTISYTTDIYKGRFKPHNSLIDYITFVAFFPQLVAGPIARAKDLLPQIASHRSAITWGQAEIGIWLIFWGLFKKIVLADNFGNLVSLIEPGLAGPQKIPGSGLIFAYAFAGQIYCDFSAYTDIARGIAKLFNIELTRNFLTPYFSSSPSDFWQRWHISLSSWLRDYLYIPLGGNREGRLKTLRNLLITMLLGGLWHGAGTGFILWGGYHGILLVAYHGLNIEYRIRSIFPPTVGRIITIFLFFNLVCLGWIFFRAPSNHLLDSFLTIGCLFFGVFPDWASVGQICWGLFLFALPLVITETIGYLKAMEFVDLYEGWSLPVKSVAYVLIFYSIIFFGARQQSEFIYFQF